MRDEEYFLRVEKIRAKLYRVAYPYFNSESMAIDMADEAIYRGYLKKRQLKDEKYMETWLIRILMNLCLNRCKKNKKQLHIDELPEESAPEAYDNLPLHQAIDRLPDNYKKPIILKYFGGYTTAEISAVLEIPQGTIATRIRKALQLLRIDLED